MLGIVLLIILFGTILTAILKTNGHNAYRSTKASKSKVALRKRLKKSKA